jgi:hypothetical protein
MISIARSSIIFSTGSSIMVMFTSTTLTILRASSCAGMLGLGKQSLDISSSNSSYEQPARSVSILQELHWREQGLKCRCLPPHPPLLKVRDLLEVLFFLPKSMLVRCALQWIGSYCMVILPISLPSVSIAVFQISIQMQWMLPTLRVDYCTLKKLGNIYHSFVINPLNDEPISPFWIIISSSCLRGWNIRVFLPILLFPFGPGKT